MSRGNWRDPAAYEWMQSLDAYGFAWEFLRRNPEFVKELRFLKRIARRRTLTQAETELFALRWGVRFQWHLRDGKGRGRCLDCPCFADCHRPHRRPTRRR